MIKLESTKTAANAVNLSTDFLYRHWKKIPGAHRAGRALRWDITELKKWMRENAQQEALENKFRAARKVQKD